MRFTAHLAKSVVASPIWTNTPLGASHRLNQALERYNFIVQYSLPAISADTWRQIIKSIDTACTHAEAIAMLRAGFSIEVDPVEAFAILEFIRYAKESGLPLEQCFSKFGIV